MPQPAIEESHAHTSGRAARPPVDETLPVEASEHEGSHSLDWIEIGRVAFVAAAAAAVWFLRGSAIPHLEWIGAICAVAGGYPIYHEAYENIVERRMTMELSMAIAIVAALDPRNVYRARDYCLRPGS